MAAFIGIDLGTTYSAVAWVDETGRPAIIHDRVEGSNITPSCVMPDGDRYWVGTSAFRTWSNAPEKAAARFKRDMGTSTKYEIDSRTFTPTQLSAEVLKKLVADAEAIAGPICEAVVTIPANFAHEAREATMAAAREAGLSVRFIINEPTAAALYYAFICNEELAGLYAVYDLGGGTFDISIIRVDGHNVDVVASNGVARLGGDDFDIAIRGIVQAKFEQETGHRLDEVDFTKSNAEEEKKSLSERSKTVAKAGRQLVDITREEFEDAISAKVTQAEMLCEATIEEAGVEAKDIRGVFLVGGSTRIPLVQESVRRVFGQEPVSSVNVDEVVALGAALYAAYRGDRSELSTVQQQAIQKIKVAESTAKCFGTVAMVYSEARDEMALKNDILIQKGEKIPCAVTETFYTVHDGQSGVDCKVTESTAPETDLRFVRIIWEGRLELPGDRPVGQEIQITFAYDDNQIMIARSWMWPRAARPRSTCPCLRPSTQMEAQSSTRSLLSSHAAFGSAIWKSSSRSSAF